MESQLLCIMRNSISKFKQQQRNLIFNVSLELYNYFETREVFEEKMLNLLQFSVHYKRLNE